MSPDKHHLPLHFLRWLFNPSKSKMFFLDIENFLRNNFFAVRVEAPSHPSPLLWQVLIIPLIREKHLHTSAWGKAVAGSSAGRGGETAGASFWPLGGHGWGSPPSINSQAPLVSLENAGLWRGEHQEEAPRLASFSPLHKLFFLFLPLKIRSVSLLHSTVLEWPGRKSFPKFVSFSLGGNASLDLMWGLYLSHLRRICPDFSPEIFMCVITGCCPDLQTSWGCCSMYRI